jgi:triosephosphate isomerase
MQLLGLQLIRVLYGGSVTPDTAEVLVRDGGADGFLVGGASLKADSFSSICATVDTCYSK